jgi:hypothetical protein
MSEPTPILLNNFYTSFFLLVEKPRKHAESLNNLESHLFYTIVSQDFAKTIAMANNVQQG